VHIHDVNRIDGVKLKKPDIKFARREPMRRSPAELEKSQDRNGGLERGESFDEVPVLGMESIRGVKSVDYEDIAIDEDQTGPPLEIDPFLSTS
jgi:hypothetical protein